MTETLDLKTTIDIDDHVRYVEKAFDLQVDSEMTTRIPLHHRLNESFENIGVIYGASGSGKSSILRMFGTEKQHQFDKEKTLISNFDFMSPEDAAQLLSAVGLASVPAWVRQYRLLSNGEQYRANLAMSLARHENTEEVLVVDEYTSVVDRNTAKSMSNALQKYIRRRNLKVVFASCHDDVIDWLQPDWTYTLPSAVYEKKALRGQNRASMFDSFVARVQLGKYSNTITI
tara:strand:+ start:5812 stop:6501 length:690 start_codon:yes stop_codon:yes gene_type:complete